MKKYVKEIDGKKVYKTRQQIIISNNGMSTYNPTEEMILSDGWVEYIAPVYEETIEDVRANVLRRLEDYDTSDEVNGFYVSGMHMWLDKATRVGLILRFNAETGSGKTDTSLWYNGMEFPLTLDNAIQMLYAIELYASACYDNTQKHIANIKTLETKEEIENYNFRTGYPEKLNF